MTSSNHTVAAAVFGQIGFMKDSNKQAAALIWILQNAMFVAVYPHQSLVEEFKHRIWQVSNSFEFHDFIFLADTFDAHEEG